MFRSGFIPDRVSCRRIFALCCGLGVLSGATLSAQTPETPTRAFDLQADVAERSLKLFSEQSGRGLLVAAEIAINVHTNAVRGRFTVQAALDLMLARTGLVAKEDPKSGAFVVHRESSGPNGRRASPTQTGERPANSDNSLTGDSRKGNERSTPPTVVPMKRNKFLTKLTAIVTLLVGSPAVAQNTGDARDFVVGTATISGRVQNLATGKYLNNVRISVRGTNALVFTDEYGAYRLVNVPSGPVVLEAFYTGLDPQQVSLQAPSGGAIEQNIALTSQSRYGVAQEAVKLDAFIVLAQAEADAQALATNEQRFAPNIKNVIPTDVLGDGAGGNIGEFLKFIPGVTVEYDNADPNGISMRGLGPNMTMVTAEGVAPASAWNAVGGRETNLYSLSLNSYSRIEATKVPTPSTAADSLGGSVNLVSKSAFEHSGAKLNYGVHLVGNSDNMTLRKTPTRFLDEYTRKTHPGYDFDYTLPISKSFGIVVTGSDFTKYNEQHASTMSWGNTLAGTAVSTRAPYLSSYALMEAPRVQARSNYGLKADWRLTQNSVLSVGGQYNKVQTEIGTTRVTASVGSATPTVAAGIPLTYAPQFTNGATGRGTIVPYASDSEFKGWSQSGSLNYRFDDGRWRIETGFSLSKSSNTTGGRLRGSFRGFDATLKVPVRVNLEDINPNFPRVFRAYDNSNQPVDLNDLENYRITSASDTGYSNQSRTKDINLNLRRRLNLFSFPSALQVGGRQSLRTKDYRGDNLVWTHNGPDGNPATIESASLYAPLVFKNQPWYYGFSSNLPTLSPSRAWRALQANPVLFTQTLAQQRDTEIFRVTNSEYIEETASAVYVQGEIGLLNNRLKVLGGVRWEKTEDDGEGLYTDPGLVFQRNADGSFAHNAAGARIRKPGAPAAGSLEEVALIYKERGADARRSYDGYYPSLHLTYEITENFIVRAAYAKTYGRPNFTDIIPRTTISEFDLTEEQLADPNTVQGTISLRNTALLPWSADNYDVSLEYYTKQGGMLSGGVFRKDLADFWGDSVTLANAADIARLDLDSRYLGWRLTTKYNVGDARISGYEFNVRQSLRSVGDWGRYFTVFANATKLTLEGPQQASFSSFTPKTANWGVSLNWKRLNATMRWNYRGLNKRTAQPSFGADGFDYYAARTNLDMNIAYQLNRRLAVTGSVNDLFNVPHRLLRYGSLTPDYARQQLTQEYGVRFSVGVKGNF